MTPIINRILSVLLVISLVTASCPLTSASAMSATSITSPNTPSVVALPFNESALMVAGAFMLWPLGHTAIHIRKPVTDFLLRSLHALSWPRLHGAADWEILLMTAVTGAIYGYNISDYQFGNRRLGSYDIKHGRGQLNLPDLNPFDPHVRSQRILISTSEPYLRVGRFLEFLEDYWDYMAIKLPVPIARITVIEDSANPQVLPLAPREDAPVLYNFQDVTFRYDLANNTGEILIPLHRVPDIHFTDDDSEAADEEFSHYMATLEKLFRASEIHANEFLGKVEGPSVHWEKWEKNIGDDAPRSGMWPFMQSVYDYWAHHTSPFFGYAMLPILSEITALVTLFSYGLMGIPFWEFLLGTLTPVFTPSNKVWLTVSFVLLWNLLHGIPYILDFFRNQLWKRPLKAITPDLTELLAPSRLMVSAAAIATTLMIWHYRPATLIELALVIPFSLFQLLQNVLAHRWLVKSTPQYSKWIKAHDYYTASPRVFSDLGPIESPVLILRHINSALSHMGGNLLNAQDWIEQLDISSWDLKAWVDKEGQKYGKVPWFAVPPIVKAAIIRTLQDRSPATHKTLDPMIRRVIGSIDGIPTAYRKAPKPDDPDHRSIYGRRNWIQTHLHRRFPQGHRPWNLRQLIAAA